MKMTSDLVQQTKLCVCGEPTSGNSEGKFARSESGHINRLRRKEAKEIIKSLDISTTREYQSLYRQGKLPKGTPSNPNVVYAKDRLTSD